MKEVSGTEYYADSELPNGRESHAIYVLRDRGYMWVLLCILCSNR